MTSYRICRTRLITESFRIEAENDENAKNLLADSSLVRCVDGVEQIGLYTQQCDIDFMARHKHA